MSNRLPVILIFDVGKTNKKVVLFDEKYNVVHEEAQVFPETTDEDGYPCEDIHRLKSWITDTYRQMIADERYAIRAVHFSAYGASMVYLDEQFQEIPPLYNYLKPFPDELAEQFYTAYGGESVLCRETASPRLGSLNSGLQLYRIKYAMPEKFARIRYALHLPQYLHFLLTGKVYSELTGIGCHTHLWDFSASNYHRWVTEEGFDSLLPPIHRADAVAGYTADGLPVGVGLHDSSAALIPYLHTFQEPFVLISTGTWCISLHPFNTSPLTASELKQDCLCYLSWDGPQVKASRFFGGYIHQEQAAQIARHFGLPPHHYSSLYSDPAVRHSMMRKQQDYTARPDLFNKKDFSEYANYAEAYIDLLIALVKAQVESTRLVLKGSAVQHIFVDGGFSRNPLFLDLLAQAFSPLPVYAAELAQASALGAAQVMHPHWNKADEPTGQIQLRLIEPVVTG